LILLKKNKIKILTFFKCNISTNDIQICYLFAKFLTRISMDSVITLAEGLLMTHGRKLTLVSTIGSDWYNT